MKKLFSALLLVIGSAVFCGAQTTAVTATITDSDSILWTNANFTVQFSPNPQQPNINAYTLGGVPLTSATYSSYLSQTGKTNGSGVLSVTLLDNSQILPYGSKWYFVVAPAASAQATAYVPIQITGTTLNLTTYLSQNAMPPRFPATPGAFGYADLEVEPIPNPGGFYWNTTSFVQRLWNGTSWIVNGGGGGGTGTVNSGSGYALPSYSSSATTVVGPSNITTDSSLNNLLIPGTETVGTGNHVNIGALGTPTSWNLDTTSPATALSSLGSAAPCMAAITQTVAVATATITLASIPATCNNITLTISGTTSGTTTASVYAELNTDTSADYGFSVWYAQFGSSPAGSGASSVAYLRLGDLSPQYSTGPYPNGVIIYNMPGYASTVYSKTFFGTTSVFTNSVYYQEQYAGYWAAAPAAINQITLTVNGGYNFEPGTIASITGTL